MHNWGERERAPPLMMSTALASVRPSVRPRTSRGLRMRDIHVIYADSNSADFAGFKNQLLLKCSQCKHSKKGTVTSLPYTDTSRLVPRPFFTLDRYDWERVLIIQYSSIVYIACRASGSHYALGPYNTVDPNTLGASIVGHGEPFVECHFALF